MLTSHILWLVLMLMITYKSAARRSCGNCFSHCLADGECDDYGCMAGYHGEHCTLPCPPNCRDGLNHKPLCNRTTGTCLSGCKSGFHGKTCSHRCSPHCLNNTCYQEDATCVQGCAKHWYGFQCLTPCSNRCIECGRNGLCTSCLEGFFGKYCDSTCSPRCVDGICIMNNDGEPECSRGCVSGWKGRNCDIRGEGDLRTHKRIHRDTPENECSCRKMIQDKKCGFSCVKCRGFKETITNCTYKCKGRYYGLHDDDPCNKTCSLNCNGSCHDSGECVKCPSGKFGPQCGHKCPENCLDRCTKSTGYCVQCQPGRYGDHCEKFCDFCSNSSCHKNGSCKDRCQHNRYGVNCSQVCSDKCHGSLCYLYINLKCSKGCKDTYRGEYCQERCPHNCLACHQFKGSCTVCNHGFTGANCTTTVIPVPAICVSVGIMVILLIILVAVGRNRWFCFSSRQDSGQRSSPPGQNDSSSTIGDIQTVPMASIPADNQRNKVTTPLIDQDSPTDDAAKDKPTPEQMTSVKPEVAGENQQEEGPEISATLPFSQECSSLPRRGRNGVKPFGKSLGLPDDELTELTHTLEEFTKSEDISCVKNLWTHLGYSEENIPLTTEGSTLFTMLKTSPNLKGLDTNHARYKLILALRFAGISQLANRLVNKHEDRLPRQFVDELRKVETLQQRDISHHDNVTVFRVHNETQDTKRGNFIGR